jgi:hypothetical protein
VRSRRARRPQAERCASSRVVCADTGLLALERELDAHLEAQVDDPLHARLARAVVRLVRDRDVVRAHELVVDPAHRAEEAHHERVRGLVVELARPADLLDPAVVHHRDVVGDRHRLLLVVRDQDGRDVDLVVQPAQPLAQLRADLRVERAERLVEQEHARLHRQRAGERHALALAARELVGVALVVAGEPDDAEQLVDRASISPSALADRQPERDVVAHGHVLERRVVLEHEADVAPLRRDVVTSSPVISPCRVGLSSPAMIRSSVDLPEPLGPSSAVSEPSGISSVTSSSAAKSPNACDAPVTVIMRPPLAFRTVMRAASRARAHQRGGGSVGAERVLVVDVARVDEQRQRLGLPGDAAGTTVTAPNSPSARATVRTTP